MSTPPQPCPACAVAPSSLLEYNQLAVESLCRKRPIGDDKLNHLIWSSFSFSPLEAQRLVAATFTCQRATEREKMVGLTSLLDQNMTDDEKVSLVTSWSTRGEAEARALLIYGSSFLLTLDNSKVLNALPLGSLPRNGFSGYPPEDESLLRLVEVLGDDLPKAYLLSNDKEQRLFGLKLTKSRELLQAIEERSRDIIAHRASEKAIKASISAACNLCRDEPFNCANCEESYREASSEAALKNQRVFHRTHFGDIIDEHHVALLAHSTLCHNRGQQDIDSLKENVLTEIEAAMQNGISWLSIVQEMRQRAITGQCWCDEHAARIAQMCQESIARLNL